MVHTPRNNPKKSIDCESQRTLLPADYTPRPGDVICAKGKYSFNHEGNKKFRVVIEKTTSEYYSCASKQRKTSMVMAVVRKIRSDPDGGFIRKDSKTGLWYEIGEDAAREKVGQSLREAIVRADPVKTARKKKLRALRRGKVQAANKRSQLNRIESFFPPPPSSPVPATPMLISADSSSKISLNSLPPHTGRLDSVFSARVLNTPVGH